MGVLKARVGSVWVPISQGFTSAQVGYVAHATTSGDSNHTSQSDVPGLSVTWNAESGHRYRITCAIEVQGSTSPASIIVSILNAAGSVLYSRKAMSVPYANALQNCTIDYIESGLSGSQTRKVMVQNSAGTATVIGGNSYGPYLIVEDITQVQPADTSLITPWTDYTPTLTQGAAVAKTVRSARYAVNAKTVTVMVNLQASAAGTAPNGIRIGLPIAARAANSVYGVGMFFDASAAQRYIVGTFGLTTTEAGFGIDGVSSDILGISPAIALASGDEMMFNLEYEAA